MYVSSVSAKLLINNNMLLSELAVFFGVLTGPRPRSPLCCRCGGGRGRGVIVSVLGPAAVAAAVVGLVGADVVGRWCGGDMGRLVGGGGDDVRAGRAAISLKNGKLL